MRRGRPGRWAAALLALAAGCAAPPARFRPHVIVVVVDCLRADHVGAYGYPRPTTPNLDRLAAEGIRFDAAYANGTWTKPSIATLFSGLYPAEHGLLRVGIPAGDELDTDTLAPEIPMLAASFSAAGYRTIAAVAQIHLKSEFGFSRGFGEYLWFSNLGAFRLNRRLFETLGPVASDRPVFAWLHYIDAHWPYRAGPGGPRPELGATAMNPEPPHEQTHETIRTWIAAHLNEANRRALAARYDHEVALVDAAIGDLVARLRSAGVLDDTLLVVTADHGEGFFEHGNLTHGFEPYEEVAHVPLIVRPPRRLGLPTGVRTTPVSHVDFAPTLLDLLGLPPLAGASGRSYAQVLAGREERQRAVLIQAETSNALRLGNLKVLRRDPDRIEVYDLSLDPGEHRDLAAGGCTGACAALAAQLEQRLRALGPRRPSGHGRFDADEVRRLRALGYL